MNNKVNTLIIGSGVGGLGCACWMKHHGSGLDFMVMEASAELPMNLHNGVHYLHSIPELPFKPDLKKITLTDGVLSNDEILHVPSLKHALEYSEKVREIQHPSSIMEVGKEDTVYLPSSNCANEFLQEMYEYAGKENFHFGCWLSELDTEKKLAIFKSEGKEFNITYENLISTVPLDKFRGIIKNDYINSLSLKYSPVYITNYKVEKIVPNWMINLYIPDKNSPVYRASILNGICSVESIRTLTKGEIWQVKDMLGMFHLSMEEEVKTYTWSTGKVISISMDERYKAQQELEKLGIYLVGRFACWNRKLLIDNTISQSKEVVEKIYGHN
jgi:hypothetical protein